MLRCCHFIATFHTLSGWAWIFYYLFNSRRKKGPECHAQKLCIRRAQITDCIGIFAANVLVHGGAEPPLPSVMAAAVKKRNSISRINISSKALLRCGKGGDLTDSAHTHMHTRTHFSSTKTKPGVGSCQGQSKPSVHPVCSCLAQSWPHVCHLPFSWRGGWEEEPKRHPSLWPHDPTLQGKNRIY